MGFLNPTRDIFWFVYLERFVSLAHRLHVSHIGCIHNIFLLLFARVAGVKLHNRSTHGEGTSAFDAPGHIEEDRGARFTKRFDFLLYLSLSKNGGIPVDFLLFFQFDLLRPLIEPTFIDYQIRGLVKRSVVLHLYFLCYRFGVVENPNIKCRSICTLTHHSLEKLYQIGVPFSLGYQISLNWSRYFFWP